ncbi:hypothetical protein [Nannocystis punicea]|uniref:Uncharacterized protein n=1 Tax=Nannocystis punicea TaxID=2995304 RepID=A0ABY7GYS2_9BACT|nr:hypothetical protein [Nannocystis poenicansa]WAS91944.1 hypothetical protein O0S08_37665 [Nannocystis poenicansa]
MDIFPLAGGKVVGVDILEMRKPTAWCKFLLKSCFEGSAIQSTFAAGLQSLEHSFTDAGQLFEPQPDGAGVDIEAAEKHATEAQVFQGAFQSADSCWVVGSPF